MPNPTFHTISNANGNGIRSPSVPTSSDGPDQAVKIFLCNPVQVLPLPEVWLPGFQVISDVLQLCKPGQMAGRITTLYTRSSKTTPLESPAIVFYPKGLHFTPGP